MILFPTRNRPQSLKRFIDNYKATGATLPVMVIVDEDNLSVYEEEWRRAPFNWVLYPNKAVRNLRDALNNAFNTFPDEPFYGIVADDIIPHTDQWDTKLAEAAGKHNIAWGNDTIWGDKLPTHPFIGGDLCKAWGWFSSPYTNRNCADFIWKDFADELGVGRYLPDVIMQHMHWQNGTAPFDSTYALQPSAVEGHHEYHGIYKNSEQFKADVMRVREKIGL